jgi:hypothetical protein
MITGLSLVVVAIGPETILACLAMLLAQRSAVGCPTSHLDITVPFLVAAGTSQVQVSVP